ERNCLVEGPLSNLQVSLLQFSRPKQSYRGPQRYQMAYQHASNMAAAAGRGNGAPVNGRREGYADNGSIVGYIPDDVSSIHSSALGGAALPSQYPPMFQGFTETWPTLPGGARGQPLVGSSIGNMNGKSHAPASVAGESVAPSEFTDITNTDVGGGKNGQGGVSLGGLGVGNELGMAKQTSLSQSDRLKRYVEGEEAGIARLRGGLGRVRLDDDDGKSVSTAFNSQIGAFE
ncbi:hypothetical protein LTR28_007053, partial [Elasticomyces elasticus]